MRDHLFEPGDIPPLGTVPRKMYASVIRRERYGPPHSAFRTEVVDVPEVGRGHVLVLVMAAGINYNNVWAALGKPLDVISARLKRGAREDFHIGGSEASGVVWAVGEDVTTVAVGDEVVLSGCQWNETAPDIRLGADPMTSATQQVWGYETNHGSFAQYTLVHDYQCHPKPPHLTWEEAACFLLSAATAHRQLCGWPPHDVQPGDPVLIWGGAGGLGSMAIQITRLRGGIPIAVVSSPQRARHCQSLGAHGTIDRRDFHHFGPMPDPADNQAHTQWLDGVRAFGRRFWEVLGERRSPRIVVEHTGRDTLPTSLYLCDNAGMVVTCGATTGYQADVDLRYLWMRQKRLQGSHFANLRQSRDVVHLAATGQLNPCLNLAGALADIGTAHQRMHDNQHPPGNQAVLINAPHPGLTTLQPQQDPTGIAQ
ncbi:crotonyl-CoA carboxylase/reductase [Streptomyces sp. NPDC049555]|uniref:crotonyl-CoA carboxylase/reductase n=1 Tax=Streptomyces sp. NPDC049555 TaxID=3154930 RepID=UPI00343CD138